MVRKRRLGLSNIEVTPIGIGCAQMASTGIAAGVYPKAESDGVVRAALGGGISWFDSAEGYGGAEHALTDSLRDSGVAPGDVVIATKWLPFGRWASNISRTIGDRIRELQGYPVDLYQVHMPTALSSIEAEMREMAKLLHKGQIRAVGVSNFSAAQMRRAAAALQKEGAVLASNQVRISLLDREIERNGILQAARELNVTLIAHSPLRAGILTGRFHDDPTAFRQTHWLRRFMLFGQARDVERSRALVNELGNIAKSYGVSRAQIALNWLIHFYGDTVVAIPGASKAAHAEQSAGAQTFQLTDGELRRLDQLSR